jgi:taurine dioxygenase
MAYQSIDVRKLTPTIGAEIFGVDLGKPLGNQQFQEVHDALMDNLVIFFRDQKMSIEQHKEFGRRFGPLHTHPNAPIAFPDHPEILVIKADEKSKRVAGEEWHTDVSCDTEPPMGSILYLTEVPPDGGGDTLFANMYRAYETLSEPIKQMLQGLTALHDSSKAHYYRVKATDRQEMKFPNAEHPVVRTHPVTGKQGLYVNRGFTLRIPPKRERRASGDALPPHRDAGVPVPLQVAGELGGVLGQPLCPASRHVRLLPASPLRPPRDGVRRQAVLPGSLGDRADRRRRYSSLGAQRVIK